ncbi:bifunctional 4-hydroxy-2-oxoglutarate aldolase/2-dehydro-3-deoxy-phosphogluconate aldolase [Oecophyllibacter saccharovorans]|uniref:2-dehydro-3-deoxy-phosphogluconate aldolase n=1 Tax=Oecophyllibacter saccharovorans TaxID=2558360 RepID=A0A506URL2_9PROT|nr:bifunctional 4-hydroxy-2-oxoglutarate aldolase/2-dehydro-3-deoxy-phosphogluconate aldolase [Oecophyllibacter saccharovorans]QDH14836.1 bifunctional 4-hydroxy-2-oxoglutarate aldolase/2-dehydro-3-deoxy-phosphogluconate aldolase [Oecophyllibacter saccharovorans]TPW35037.1 bifunctional 4-hydroxy-2-oxoglutarate aldolase/2-dehydro-3-deoxy-phosphogluconate aldolase [Oecophyllibacter saccharovorans]TPW35978.1 bifunctional 4-hydroxy-2-oxoglutarate aldolase/2-dehydro-3-deoxy-phosphogluconate aldolase [
MTDLVKELDAIMDACPIMPVLVVKDVALARPLAEALVSNGVTTLEVTLRTPCALEVIREMSKVPGALVGAGTVLHGQHVEQAAEAGAKFLVSPGLTRPLAEAAHRHRVPFLPGIANASDIMCGLDLGLRRFKYFPAMTNGGIPGLKSLASVFGSLGVRFCPTGGITEQTYKDWLALPFVACVGGSWLTAGDASPEVVAQRAKALGLKK